MLHWGPGRRFARWGPSGDADASALIAAMTVPPDGARQALINQTIVAIKAAGVWTKLDLLYVLAAHDAQAARLNWKNPTANTLTVVGAPAFVVDRGYTGSGTTRLDTGFSPSTAGGQYSQDSAHHGFWGNTEGGISATGAPINISSQQMYVVAQNAAGTGVHRTNSAANSVFTSASTVVHIIALRRDAANQLTWRNGVAQAPTVGASLVVQAGNIQILNNTAGGAPYIGQLSVAHLGGALSDAECAALSAALAAYRTAVGL